MLGSPNPTAEDRPTREVCVCGAATCEDLGSETSCVFSQANAELSSSRHIEAMLPEQMNPEESSDPTLSVPQYTRCYWVSSRCSCRPR
jgi:hypothetical protein